MARDDSLPFSVARVASSSTLFYALFALILLASAVAGVLAQFPPMSISKGLVNGVWFGPGCTGEAKIVPFGGGPLNTCHPDPNGPGSMLIRCDLHSGINMQFFFDKTCTGPVESTTYSVSQCLNIYLANISLSFACDLSGLRQSQPPIPGMPILGNGTVTAGKECAEAGKCEGSPQTIFWASPGCQGAPDSSSSVYDGLIAGENNCYLNYDTPRNMQASCQNNGRLTVRSFQAGCNHRDRAYMVETWPTNQCLPDGAGGSKLILCN